MIHFYIKRKGGTQRIYIDLGYYVNVPKVHRCKIKNFKFIVLSVKLPLNIGLISHLYCWSHTTWLLKTYKQVMNTVFWYVIMASQSMWLEHKIVEQCVLSCRWQCPSMGKLLLLFSWYYYGCTAVFMMNPIKYNTDNGYQTVNRITYDIVTYYILQQIKTCFHI